jgi:hypothetical protein
MESTLPWRLCCRRFCKPKLPGSTQGALLLNRSLRPFGSGPLGLTDLQPLHSHLLTAPFAQPKTSWRNSDGTGSHSFPFGVIQAPLPRDFGKFQRSRSRFRTWLQVQILKTSELLPPHSTKKMKSTKSTKLTKLKSRQRDTWTRVLDTDGDLPPASLDAMALVAHGGKLFVGGGDDGGTPPTTFIPDDC